MIARGISVTTALLLTVLWTAGPSHGDARAQEAATSPATRADDLRRPETGSDWLAVAPRRWLEVMEPLVTHRSNDGLRARVVAIEEVADAFGPGAEGLRAFIQHAAAHWPAPAPRYLVLVGRPPEIPTFTAPALESARELGEGAAQGNRSAATDHPYALAAAGESDEGPDPFAIARTVGRLPVASDSELRELVTKIINADRHPATGAWQRRISLVAGEAGFGGAADAAIETLFARAVAGQLPPRYDVEFTYAKPGSPWFYPPEDFSSRVVELLSDGPLVFAYIGHGQRFRFDDVKAGGKRYPIFDREALAKLRESGHAGRSFVLINACSTGWFDDPDPKRRGIAEELCLGRSGALAVLAASRVSHPYANAVLALGLIDHLFGNSDQLALTPDHIIRIGDAAFAAKAALGTPGGGGPLRIMVDLTARSQVGSQERLERLLREEAHLFNLFGDPASHLPLPRRASLEMVPAGPVDAGQRVKLAGVVQGMTNGRVLVTLETPRDHAMDKGAPLPPGVDLDPKARGARALRLRIRRAYERANDPVIARVRADVRNGKFKVTIRIPEKIKPGRLVIKALVTESASADLDRPPFTAAASLKVDVVRAAESRGRNRGGSYY